MASKTRGAVGVSSNLQASADDEGADEGADEEDADDEDSILGKRVGILVEDNVIV